jgi:branched-chain amino acid transport system substrate-binding protein
MIRNSRGRAAAALIAAALAVAAEPVSAELLIAVAGPSQGRETDRAARLLEAARAAAAAANSAGGVNGESLVVEHFDDGCARDSATAAAESIVARKPALVLGHPCTAAALAAAEVYGRATALFVATATRHPALTDKRAGPTIFRLSGRDDRQGEVAARLLSRAAADEAVAVVHDRTRYARELAESAVAALKRERGVSPITATIIGGDLDYKRTVAKIKGAAIIFFAGFPLEGGLIYSALREVGSTAEFIGSDTLATEEFSTTFAASAKGVRVLASAAAPPDLSNVADETGDALRTRAAVESFMAAAKAAQSSDPARIAAALAGGAYVTSFGPISFSAGGDANIPSFQLVEWRGDAWRGAMDAPEK